MILTMWALLLKGSTPAGGDATPAQREQKLLFPSGHESTGLAQLTPVVTPTGRSPAPAAPKFSLPVTNGLIGYWPNLFDARDEVTGTEGHVMGVIPRKETGSVDDTTFDYANGWIQLRPAISNEVNTLVGWFRPSKTQSFVGWVILGQQFEGTGWWLRGGGGGAAGEFAATVTQNSSKQDVGSKSFQMGHGVWNHMAFAHSSNGTTTVWKDGHRVITGTAPGAWPGRSPFLCVGNKLQGDEVFHSEIRGLCAFDRVLSDEEVRALHDSGVGEAIVNNTPTRLLSTAREIIPRLSNSVTTNRPERWTHRRFTTEQGLPGNMVQAILQSREGYLWVGVEGGLARFDGTSFRVFDHKNTAAMRVTGDDILSLAEAEDGTLWAGTFGGLLRVRGLHSLEISPGAAIRGANTERRQLPTTSLAGHLEITAYTNGLTEGFVREIVPAADGWLWIAGVRNQSPRGAYVVRRYHPATGVTSAKVTVPGQMARLSVATNGVWMATTLPTQLLFWDGNAEMPSVVASVGWPIWWQKESLPPAVRVANNPLLPATTSVQIWSSGKQTSEWLAELDLNQSTSGVLGLHWQWTKGSRAEVCLEVTDLYGDVFLGGSPGLKRLRKGQLEPILIPDLPGPPEIVSLCSTRDGSVWFGTDQDGLHLAHEKLVHTFTTKDGLPGNEIQCLVPAPDGTLWVATEHGLTQWQPGAGLQLDPRYFCCFQSTSNGPDWCVYNRAGDSVGRISNTGQIEPFLAGLNINEANGMLKATDGRVWIAHQDGLCWIQPGNFGRSSRSAWRPRPDLSTPASGEWRSGRDLPNAEAVGVIEDRTGSIWVGSKGGGLTRIAPASSASSENPPESAGTISHTNRSAGDRSLAKRTFTTRDGLAADYCFPSLIDSQGTLWISGEGGLTRYKNGRFQAVRPEQGLPEDTLSAGIEDGLGYLWFAGRKGIHRLSCRELDDFFSGQRRNVSTVTLAVREGMITPECTTEVFPTMAKTPDGHIWVATRSGLATVDPRRVEIHEHPVPLVIERLVVNRQDMTFRSENTLTTAHGERTNPAENREFNLLPAGSGRRVEIHTAAISLNEPERVQLRYRLDGYDTDWSEPGGLRVAFYTNLRPGQYLFRAQATLNRGQWSNDEATLRLTIAPYLWETKAFAAGVMGILLMAAAGFHLRRLVRLKQRHAIERRESLASERVRIAADMHDDFGPTLTQIAMLGESAKRQIRNGSDVSPTLDRISQSARDLATGVSDLNWATNPSYDDLDSLASYLREQAARQLEDGQVRARMDFQNSFPEVHLSPTFRRNLILIAKEAINNALKHANPSEVSITFYASQGRVILRIADDGPGMNSGEKGSGRQGNGLDNMRRRAEQLGGTLHIQTAPDDNTVVQVDVPLLDR